MLRGLDKTLLITYGNRLCKYADYAYYGSTELGHINALARRILQRAEVVFIQTRRRHPVKPPPCLPDLTCVSCTNILGYQQVVSHGPCRLCPELVCSVDAGVADIVKPWHGQ